MKKIIISLDHVVGAIMAAYEKEMEIKSSGCSTEQDGRLVVRFSVDSIKRGQLDKLEAAKWMPAFTKLACMIWGISLLKIRK